MGGRRGRNTGYTIIYWRDIPAQITTNSNGSKIMLHPRFQNAIDRAAHVAGLTETQKYIEQWHKVTKAVQSDVEQAAQAAAVELETKYHRLRLEALVKSGGVETNSAGTGGPTDSESAGGQTNSEGAD